jgi:hypothetical protein
MHQSLNHSLLPFLDQTLLVSALIEIDMRFDENERIIHRELDELKEFNSWLYRLKTSWGYIIVSQIQYEQTYNELAERRQGLISQIEQLERLSASQTDIREIAGKLAEINNEFDCYEDAESFRKTVFSWWVIPHWLEARLIERGEAVLRGYSSSWWGITDSTLMHPAMSDVLKNIYDEISIDHAGLAS